MAKSDQPLPQEIERMASNVEGELKPLKPLSSSSHGQRRYVLAVSFASSSSSSQNRHGRRMLEAAGAT